jgi:DUF971 family protein
MEYALPPTSIRRQPEKRQLLIQWPDGLESALAYAGLRSECPCARCVNEITGQRMIDPTTIDPQIGIDALELVGGYALKIAWSDGHNQGLYTWRHLRTLCEAAQSKGSVYR